MDDLPQDIKEIIYFHWLDNNIFDNFYNHYFEIKKLKHINYAKYKQIKELWNILLICVIKNIILGVDVNLQTFYDFPVSIEQIKNNRYIGATSYNIYQNVIRSITSNQNNILFNKKKITMLLENIKKLKIYNENGITIGDIKFVINKLRPFGLGKYNIDLRKNNDRIIITIAQR